MLASNDQAPWGDGSSDVVVDSRRRIIAVVVFALALILVITRFTGVASTPTSGGETAAPASTQPEPTGPLRIFGGFGDATTKVTSNDEIVSTSLATFYNSGAEAVTLSGFEAVGASNVELVGVKFVYDGPGFKPYVGKVGFPDPASLEGGRVLELADVGAIAPQGKVLDGKPADDTVLWVVLGLKLQPGASTGSLTGVALKYADAAGEQRLEMLGEQTLCLADAADCP